MKRQLIIRSNWAMPTSLLIIFALVGCHARANTSTSGYFHARGRLLTEVSATAPASASPTAGVESKWQLRRRTTAILSNIRMISPIRVAVGRKPNRTLIFLAIMNRIGMRSRLTHPNTTVPIIPVPQDKKYSLGVTPPSNWMSTHSRERLPRMVIFVMGSFSVVQATTIMPLPSHNPRKNGICSKILPLAQWF